MTRLACQLFAELLADFEVVFQMVDGNVVCDLATDIDNEMGRLSTDRQTAVDFVGDPIQWASSDDVTVHVSNENFLRIVFDQVRQINHVFKVQAIGTRSKDVIDKGIDVAIRGENDGDACLFERFKDSRVMFENMLTVPIGSKDRAAGHRQIIVENKARDIGDLRPRGGDAGGYLDKPFHELVESIFLHSRFAEQFKTKVGKFSSSTAPVCSSSSSGLPTPSPFMYP